MTKYKRQSQLIKAIKRTQESIDANPTLTLEGILMPSVRREIDKLINLCEKAKK